MVWWKEASGRNSNLKEGKVPEPAAKSVAQKHGMQTLGKALPARRAGNTVSLKSDEIPEPDIPPTLPSGQPGLPNNSQTLPQGYLTPEQQRQQELHHQQQGWNNSHPHPPPGRGPHQIQNMSSNGPLHDKKWSGGPERANGNFANHRFAQEFPSLDAAGEPQKGQQPNFPQTGGPGSRQANAKSHDNQYGPGPILRPQTEGSWTQGGGRRPSGPPPLNASSNYPPERVNMGGPTPPPMSLGQGGPVPPPLGAFPMQFRGQNPSYMYPNSGSGGFYPGGPGSGIRYGMPIPHGAPPPPGGLPVDGPPRAGRTAPPPPRPGSHFANKPIIRAEEMERMDEIGTQDGGWASTSDDIDYNKKINFSDEEDGSSEKKKTRNNNRENERNLDEEKPVKILERERSIPDDKSVGRLKDPQPYEYENGEDWHSRNRGNDINIKERDRPGPGRRLRDDDWRSGSNRYEEDPRGKKGPQPGSRQDPRNQDFQSQQSSKYGTNLPPRFQQKFQGHGGPPQSHNQQQPNQRQTPSPISTSGGKDNREPPRDGPYKILERRRGDSESSRESRDGGRFPRDKRNFNSFENEQSNDRNSEQDNYGKNSRPDFGRGDRHRRNDDGGRKASNHETRTAGPPITETKENPEIQTTEEVKKEEPKPFLRKKELSTTSWAEEMDEAESLNELENKRKEPIIIPKREEPKSREARRVIIHQTKVADMRTHVKEASPPTKKDESKHDERDRRDIRRGGQQQHHNKSQDVRQHVKDEHKDEHNKHRGPVQLKSENAPVESAVDSRKPSIKEPSPPVQPKKEEPKPVQNTRAPPVAQQPRVRDVRQNVKTVSYNLSSVDTEPLPAIIPAKKDEPKHEDRDKQEEKRDEKLESKRDDRSDNRPDHRRDNRSENRRDDRPDYRRDDRPDNRRDIRPEYNRRDERPDNRPDHRRDRDDRADHSRRDREDHNRPDHRRGDRSDHNRVDDRHDHNRRDDRRDNRRGPPQHQNKPSEPRQPHPKPTTEIPAESKPNVQPPVSVKEEVPAPIEKPKPSAEVSDAKEKEAAGDSDEKRKNGGRNDDYLYKRGGKAPAGNRNQRNQNQNQRGGSKLQGYGPPSDRKPFSTNSNKPDEDGHVKDKETEGKPSTPKPAPPAMGVPVPLMELGEISPPEMPPRNRGHHGGGGGGGYRERDRDREAHGANRAVPPRLQRGGGGGGGGPGRGEHHQGGGRGGKKKAGDSKPVGGARTNELDKDVPQDENEGEKEKQTEVSKRITAVEPAPAPPGNAWTKPITQALRSDIIQSNQHHQQGSTPPPEPKDPLPTPSSAPTPVAPPNPVPLQQMTQSFHVMGSDSSAPKNTMIFENTKLKSGKFPEPFSKGGGKGSEEQPNSLPSSIEKSLELPIGYGKAPGSSLDFGNSFENDSGVVVGTGAKPGGRLPPQRPFAQMSHQPSPISPQAVELTEGLQAVRSLWDSPADQPNSIGTDDSSLSAFGNDTFKRPETSREVGTPLQTSIGFTSGNPPTVSAIAKPTSSSSPNSGNSIRGMKPVQQQSVIEPPQAHVPLSYSPFGYGMPQAHQPNNAFSGIPAVTSPANMYGKPHTAPPAPNPVYQAFPHPDNSHIGNTRSQFSGYTNVQPSQPYGSLYLTSTFDNHYSVPSYGHGHQGHSAGVPHGQVPPGSSRMSPSSAMPNTAMTSSSGIVVGGVGMNSSGTNAFKTGRNGTGSHQPLPHPVHHGQQQGYSQMPHHLNHPSHHMSGPPKGSYPTSGLQPQTQPQLYIQFEPNQPQVLNLGHNYMSSGGMRNSGGPPPSATPPMQGLPSTGSYYGSNSNQGGVYPGGNSQGGNLQQLHMAVAPGPQSLPGGPNPHYGIPYQQQPPMNMQGYNTQGPGSGQGNPMIRPGHSNRK